MATGSHSKFVRILFAGSSIGALICFDAATAHAATAQQQAATAPRQSGKAKKKDTPTPIATDSSDTLDDDNAIVVTAQRQALETASELKRNSDTISDSIVLDEAGKVPSTSLLEILERSPGVTMNRIRSGDQGSPDGYTFEGSGIQIRGLTGTKTLLNGREIFSASGGSGLGYSDVGPELLQAVTVYKASRADLIEGGIAGTVDLRTFMPFDVHGTKIAGAVSGSYGDFSKSLTPSASLRVSTRFDTGIGEFGLLADVAYSKIKSYDSNTLIQPFFPTTHDGDRVYAPGGFSATNDQFERTRKGLYIAAQWQPTPELQFFHTTFISQWNSNRDTQLMIESQPAVGVTEDSVFNNGIFVNGGITNATSPSTGIALSSNASFTPSYSRENDYSTGFKYQSGRFSLTGSYQYTVAKSGTSKYSISLGNPGVPETDIDLTGGRPVISFAQPYTANPATSSLSNFAWLTSDNDGHQNSYQLDASYDLGDGFFKKVAVGGRLANRQETDNFVGTWWSASARGWNGVPQPYVSTAPEGDFALDDFSNFFKGDLTAPAALYIPTDAVLRGDQFDRVINTYAACAPDLYYHCSNPASSVYLYGNPPDPTFGLQPSYVTTRPKTRSLYAMVGFAHESSSPLLNFSGNIGVRWVRYDVQSEGNYVFAGNTTFYQDTADAQASLDMIGGIGNLTAWQNAHPGQSLPLTYTSISSASNRAGAFAKDYLMPSFNIKFEPRRDLILRYALTETLTPPTYSDIRAQGTASVSTTPNPLGGASTSALPGILNGYSFTSGNPTLQPETSLNNDISIEWYPRPGTAFHLSLFHKTVKHQFIFNNFGATASQFFTAVDQPQSAPADGSSPVFIDGPVIGKGNINATRNTYIKGFELGGRMYFDMLPGLLKGFGVDANATYIDGNSPDALALDMNGNALHVPLIGLSKWAYSTTLLYDLKRVSARLSWTWRSRYLATTSDASTSSSYTDPVSKQLVYYGLPVYASASGRLDASIGYRINDHFNVRLDMENITNTDQRTEMEILPGTYVRRGTFVTDRRIGFNLGFTF